MSTSTENQSKASMTFDEMMNFFNCSEEEVLNCLIIVCNMRLKKLYIKQGEANAKSLISKKS